MTEPRTQLTPRSTTIEDRALKLLGNGVKPEQVAAALGVTASRISQLLAEPEFAAQVAALRYDSLKEHTDRDAKYDSLEDKLLEKLEKSLPMMYKPEQILRAIQTVNSAKRRGQTVEETGGSAGSKVVGIILPAIISQKFTTNIHNQVVTADDQSLETLSSSELLEQARARDITTAKHSVDTLIEHSL